MSTKAAVTQAKAGDSAAAVRPAPSPATEAAQPGWSLFLEAGNQAALKLLRTGPFQPRLAIRGPGDRFEREADRAADRVLDGRGVPSLSEVRARSSVQRKCRACQEREERAAGSTQSSLSSCESSATAGDDACPRCAGASEEIQRDAISAPIPAVGPALESGVSALRGRGSPLPPTLRMDFESRFGQDLSLVRVHDGAPAARTAHLVRARAFTAGTDIVFGSGEYRPEARSGRRLLAHEVAHVVQQTPRSRRQPAVPERRQGDDESISRLRGDEDDTPLSGEVEPKGSVEATPFERLLVEDDSPAAPGQLTRGLFLERLGPAVYAAAEEGLDGTAHTARGCPWIAHYFRHYARLTAERIETDLRRLLPESWDVRSADELVPLIAGRVRTSVQHWAAGGEGGGLPEGVPRGLPGMGMIGAIAGSLAGAGERWFAGRAEVSRSQNNDDAVADRTPDTVFAGLGDGRPLAGSVRARMESAFGARFGRVRIHTSPAASRTASRLGASAFTVGPDIAFASGRYQPGSLWGDALLAHELAHTEQQRGAARSDGGSSSAHTGALEADADTAAAGALARLFGIRSQRPAVLRSGLALQRCGETPPTAAGPSTVPPSAGPASPSESPATPGETPPTAPTETDAETDTETDEAAARAEAIEGLLGDADCEPTPTTLKKMAAIPGASLTNFGFTKPGTISRRINRRFDGSTKECFLKSFKAAALTFDHLVYVGVGVHKYGSQKRHDSGCGKDLPLHVEVNDEAAKLFKAAEVEHCRDLRLGFAQTFGKFNAAAAAVKAEGRFPAKNGSDCGKQIKDKISAHMGFDYDQTKPIFDCFHAKSKERDRKGWHDVDVNLTSERRADPGCTKVVHVLDHTKVVPDVGVHSTKDLIKGCP